MKIIRIQRYLETHPFGVKPSCWSVFWRVLLFLAVLLLFLLLFTLRGCDRGEDIFRPGRTVITPGGDTLRGQNPRLMNPENDRGTQNADITPGGYIPDDSRFVDWPKGGDGPMNPALPSPGENRMSPVNSEERVTDPDNGKELDGAHLFVILDSDAGDVVFNSFAGQLSAAYQPEVCSIEYYNTLSKTILLKVDPQLREEIKNELPSKIARISFYVADVELLTNNYIPDDPAFSFPDCSWQFEPVQAYDAWEMTKGSQNVTVAIIDSYFDMYHPDLRNVSVVSPYSVERGTNNVLPVFGLIDTDPGSYVHGTHVAGIVFATMGNKEGSSGIAPGCRFLPVSLGGVITNYAQIEGILYAVYNGASVINLSMGVSFNPDIVQRITLRDQVAIAEAYGGPVEHLWDYVFHLCNERNVTIVWASGNQNVLSSLDASKRNGSTVRVEAVNQSLRKADFSNFGILPDYGVNNSTVSAPGCGIVSSIPGGDYLSLDGTSMAAPIVTGAVALMKSLDNNLKNSDVVEILRETSKPLEDRNIAGLLQIGDALRKVKDNFLRFDDVISDHTRLLGKWEATSNFSVTIDGEETGETVKLEMEFDSTESGTVALTYLNGAREGIVCSAPLRVTFSADDMTIRDMADPTDGDKNKFTRSIYRCAPDDSGLLSVSCKQGDDEKILDFYMRKINR